MTSLARQDTRSLGGPFSILTRQKRDHERLDKLLQRLALSSPGAQEEAVLQAIARLVFPHAFAEESVIWPEARRVLPDGEQLTLQVEQEHQEVNELWAALERLPSGSPGRTTALVRLTEVLRQDVRDEEDELLPRLQDALGVRRLQVLGLAWEAVRRTAPTRPHAVVSRRSPGQCARRATPDGARPLARRPRLGRTTVPARAPAGLTGERPPRVARRARGAHACPAPRRGPLDAPRLTARAPGRPSGGRRRGRSR